MEPRARKRTQTRKGFLKHHLLTRRNTPSQPLAKLIPQRRFPRRIPIHLSGNSSSTCLKRLPPLRAVGTAAFALGPAAIASCEWRRGALIHEGFQAALPAFSFGKAALRNAESQLEHQPPEARIREDRLLQRWRHTACR